jgi:predicted RNA-binding Zn-ribbon protein involved in translation (DUF1610 family)
VRVYGKTRTMHAAVVTGALWHGSFNDTPGQLVLVRAPDSRQPYDLALFTLDLAATPAAIIERYSWRWPIEPSNATGKQILGVGQACSRLEAAVERTVPFGFLVQSLLIVWYARSGYDPADVGLRRLLCPWYRTKHEPAAAGMPAKLRREFLKARFSADPGTGPWSCPNCGRTYILRRCSACGAVSHVSADQRRGVEWACVWCGQFNTGYKRRDAEAHVWLRRDPSDGYGSVAGS